MTREKTISTLETDSKEVQIEIRVLISLLSAQTEAGKILFSELLSRRNLFRKPKQKHVYSSAFFPLRQKRKKKKNDFTNLFLAMRLCLGLNFGPLVWAIIGPL